MAGPFSPRPCRGRAQALGVHRFESGWVTLAQAAKVAGLSVEEFVALLGEAGIPAVDYAPDELKEELDIAL